MHEVNEYLYGLVSLMFFITLVAMLSRKGAIELQDIADAKRNKESLARELAEEKAIGIANTCLELRAAEVEHKKEMLAITIKLEAALSANGAFQSSRDQVWDMHRRSSLAAGNAQAWLFRELNNMMLVVNGYKKKNGEDELLAPHGLESALEDFKKNNMDPDQKAPGSV